jgi:hypothetical protein
MSAAALFRVPRTEEGEPRQYTNSLIIRPGTSGVSAVAGAAKSSSGTDTEVEP